MSTPRNDPETSTAVRGFPIWPGVLVGLGVAFGLVGLEMMHALPPTVVRTLGGLMVVTHGLVAFAVVTLLGEALTIAGWDRALGEWLDRPSNADATDSRSQTLIDSQPLHAAIERNTRSVLERWEKNRRTNQVVAYIVPLIGFGVSLWDAGGKNSWWTVRQPFILSLWEASFVLVLTLGVTNASAVVRDGWLLLTRMRRSGNADEESSGRMRTITEKP